MSCTNSKFRHSHFNRSQPVTSKLENEARRNVKPTLCRMDSLALAQPASTLLTSSGRLSGTRYRVTTDEPNSPNGPMLFWLLHCCWKKILSRRVWIVKSSFSPFWVPFICPLRTRKKGRIGEIQKAGHGVIQDSCKRQAVSFPGSLVNVKVATFASRF